MREHQVIKRGDNPITWDMSVVAHIQDAGHEAVQAVLDMPADTDNGRSGWKWVRLADGSLILGCFPHGDTYFATEHDRSI